MNTDALNRYDPANALPDVPDEPVATFDDLDGAMPDKVDDRLADWICDNLDVVKDLIKLHQRHKQPGCDPYRAVLIRQLEEAGGRAMAAVEQDESLVEAWREALR